MRHIHVIYNYRFNIHNYRHTLPTTINYHILYWSAEYFLSRVSSQGKLHKDGISYDIRYLNISYEDIIEIALTDSMRQLALSFRSCPDLPSLVLVKLGDK